MEAEGVGEILGRRRDWEDRDKWRRWRNLRARRQGVYGCNVQHKWAKMSGSLTSVKIILLGNVRMHQQMLNCLVEGWKGVRNT